MWAASIEEGPSCWRRDLQNSTSLTQMCSGEGLRKRPSFWVRSERCAVATGDLLLRSNQKTEAVQVTVSVQWTSLAWPALPWPVVAALESG